MTRKDYNMKILAVLESMVNSNPDLRLVQILNVLDVNSLLWNEEPEETLKKMVAALERIKANGKSKKV